MVKQKRPQEEDSELPSESTSSKEKLLDFKCTCGKSYGTQSSLYNHIRIKHDNDKEQYEIKRGVKPGRPKNNDLNSKASQKMKRKETKPDHIDQNTWELLNLYKDDIFQNLLIKFQGCMKTELQSQSDVAEQKLIWEEYKKWRNSLLKQVLPKNDIKPFSDRVDFILQRWSLLLDKKHQLELFTNFCAANLLKFYDLSDQKKDIIKRESCFNEETVQIIQNLLNEDHQDVSQNYVKDEEINQEDIQEGEDGDGAYQEEEEDDDDGYTKKEEQYSNNIQLQENSEIEPNYINDQNGEYDGQQHLNMNNNQNNNQNNNDDIDDEMNGVYDNLALNNDYQATLGFEMANDQQFGVQQSLLNRESYRFASFRNQNFYVEHLGQQEFNHYNYNFQSIQQNLNHFQQNLNGNAHQQFNENTNDNTFGHNNGNNFFDDK